MIFGEEPIPMSDDEYFEGQDTIDILKGNRFAAELAYSFDGFNVGFNRVFKLELNFVLGYLNLY